MLHPSYKEMIRKINNTAKDGDMEISSRYSLVIAAAKRARQINSGSEPLVDAAAKEKNLSVAVDEFFSGKVHILEEDEEPVREELMDTVEEAEDAYLPDDTEDTEEVPSDEAADEE